MDDLSVVARVEDRVTFGAEVVPFIALLVGVFFASVFGLIRVQTVRAPYGPLSPVLYLGFTVVGLIVAYAVLRRIARWTFAPSLHRRWSAIVTVVVYFGIAIIAVFIGYLIINPQTRAVAQLSLPDVLVGVTVASIYTAILSATSLLQDPAELLGKPRKRERCIHAWLKAHEEAVEAEGYGPTHTQAYEEFVEQSASLLDELEEAKTNEGERLRSVFDEWFSDFRQRDSTVRRQAILTGETDNDRLSGKHQTLTWVRKLIADIGGDEVWNDTNP